MMIHAQWFVDPVLAGSSAITAAFELLVQLYSRIDNRPHCPDRRALAGALYQLAVLDAGQRQVA